MKKLEEVQEAKDLMNEAMDWSAFKWLFEKSRVRETADRANAALDRQERAVKARWHDEAKAIYKERSAKKSETVRRTKKGEQPAESTDSEVRLLVEKVLEADQAAHRTRMEAEDIFEQAEKQMSASLAREGCKKAIHSWELHEKAIRKAEALAEATQPKE